MICDEIERAHELEGVFLLDFGWASAVCCSSNEYSEKLAALQPATPHLKGSFGGRFGDKCPCIEKAKVDLWMVKVYDL